jgi:hypothetical protein
VVLVAVLALLSAYLAGMGARNAKLSDDRDAWRTTARGYLAAAEAWEASFHGSEAARGQERIRAEGAVNAAAKACDTRVAAARRSAAAIQTIVTKEVRYDESRCPVRAVVGSGELRDALGLAAGR